MLAGENTQINLQVVARWALDATRGIGVYPVLDMLQTTIEVQNFSADLPNNFYRLIDVGSSSMQIEHGHNLNSTQPTIAIHNCKLRSNFRSGKIEMAYYAIPVDEDNLPLIDEDYYEAIKNYLVARFLELKMIARPELVQMFQFYMEQYRLFAGMARAEKMMPTSADTRRIIRQKHTGYRS